MLEIGICLRDKCVRCKKTKLVMTVYVNDEDIYVTLCKKCLRKYYEKIIKYLVSLNEK